MVASRQPLLDSLRLVTSVLQQPGELERCSQAVRARGFGSSGRRDGTDGFHGFAVPRVALEGFVSLQVILN
jgi:hypothetical protein